MAEEKELPGYDLRHHSSALGMYKTARLVIPAGCSPSRPAPIAILLHAFAGNRFSWLRTHLATVGAWRMPFIAVFPESGRNWFINDARGRRYEDYLIQDLLDAVVASVGTDRVRDGRLVAGYSMGGAAALFIALRHPGVFDKVFSYAGAFAAARRHGDPYARFRGQDCVMPTQREHDRVWGKPGSPTRAEYDPDTVVVGCDRDRAAAVYLEVGLQDYERVVQMNRDLHVALEVADVSHEFVESDGSHCWEAACLAFDTWAQGDGRYR